MVTQAAQNEVEDPRIARSRDVIRRAVLEELAAVGYGALTIEAVARRARVGKSTIYRHWAGRVQLIADAFEHAHHDMVPESETGTARDRILRLVGHVVAVVSDPLYSRCIPALIDGAEHDARLRAFHHHYSDLRRRELGDVISEGIANGEIDESIDSEAAAVAILGVVFYRRLMTPNPLKNGDAAAVVDGMLRAVGQ